MKRSVTLVEDGSPEAAALAHWLESRVDGVRRITASGPDDVDRVIQARRAAGASERRVALSDQPVDDDVSARAAMRCVHSWLASLDPFGRRIEGPAVIEERAATEEGAALRDLARILSTGRAPTRPSTGRGRPRGSSRPLRGVGFDLCVALLLEPTREWSERELAEAIGRSRYGVHRSLVALDELGYLSRQRGATKPSDALLLRNDLAAAWAERHRRRRAAWFVAPRPATTVEDAVAALDARRISLLLAGPSATDHLTGGTSYAYATDDVAEALRGAGFSPSTGRGQLAVWSVEEQGVLYRPEEHEPAPRTNWVVTHLDLIALGGERNREAAEEVWVG